MPTACTDSMHASGHDGMSWMHAMHHDQHEWPYAAAGSHHRMHAKDACKWACQPARATQECRDVMQQSVRCTTRLPALHKHAQCVPQRSSCHIQAQCGPCWACHPTRKCRDVMQKWMQCINSLAPMAPQSGITPSRELRAGDAILHRNDAQHRTVSLACCVAAAGMAGQAHHLRLRHSCCPRLRS